MPYPPESHSIGQPIQSSFRPSPTSDHSDNELTLHPTGFPTIENIRAFHLNSIVGLSFKSPISLLNSAIDAQILGDRLTRIYEAIATPSASRFLDYDCNLYPPKIRYRIIWGVCMGSNGSSPAASGTKSHAGPHNHTDSMPTHDEIGHEISLLGSVRFLDHFGDLYGNRLKPAARKQSDKALKAVLRACSVQWPPSAPETYELGLHPGTSPSSRGLELRENDSSLNSFIDAWIQARSLLLETKDIRSFRMVLATFTFVGIVTPMRIIDEGLVPTDLLDTALKQLCSLDQLVTRYCTNLGAFF